MLDERCNFESLQDLKKAFLATGIHMPVIYITIQDLGVKAASTTHQYIVSARIG